jgi:hypothetical protein
MLSAANLQLSEDDNVLVQGVSGDPYAIGYFGFAYFEENAGTPASDLAIEGVAPTVDTVNAGDYPLARPLFIYSDASIMAAKTAGRRLHQLLPDLSSTKRSSTSATSPPARLPWTPPATNGWRLCNKKLGFERPAGFIVLHACIWRTCGTFSNGCTERFSPLNPLLRTSKRRRGKPLLELKIWQIVRTSP